MSPRETKVPILAALARLLKAEPARQQVSWRDQWESHADAESGRHNTTPTAELLEHIRNRRFGDYHTIWYSVARRANPAEAAWVMFDVLMSKASYLVRYHCAAALLQLLDCTQWDPVELSAARFPLARNLEQLRAVIVARVGSTACP